MFWGEVQQAAGAAERLSELMTIKPDIVSPERPRPFPAGKGGQVAFEHVSFHYPGRADCGHATRRSCWQSGRCRFKLASWILVPLAAE
jgi:ABC-type multidrug transport system fused ATPase/permease subunit